jgi:hypothetical protein
VLGRRRAAIEARRMMKPSPAALGLLSVLLHALTLVATQTNRDLAFAQPGRRVALVVGIDSYEQAPLANARNDSRAVGAALRELGFAVTQLENTNREQFASGVSRFAESLTSTDVAWFFFAGHGVQIAGENFLIPGDFKGDSPSAVRLSALPLAEIQNAVSKARVSIVVLDACRNNPFLGSRGGGTGLAPFEARGNLVAFATAAGQTASDNGRSGNGLFTQELLKYLRQRELSIRDVFFRVRQSVFDTSNGQQFPAVYDGLLGDFSLGGLAAPLTTKTMATGALVVRTTPPGAQVILDGEVHGISPVAIRDVKPGGHSLLVRMDGHVQDSRTLEIEAGKETGVDVSLARSTVVNSAPVPKEPVTEAKVPVTRGSGIGKGRLFGVIGGVVAVGGTAIAVGSSRANQKAPSVPQPALVLGSLPSLALVYGPPVTFNYTISNVNAGSQYDVVFQFGDGEQYEIYRLSSPGATNSVRHTYRSPGTYQTRVTVKDLSGSETTSTYSPIIVQTLDGVWAGRVPGSGNSPPFDIRLNLVQNGVQVRGDYVDQFGGTGSVTQGFFRTNRVDNVFEGSTSLFLSVTFSESNLRLPGYAVNADAVVSSDFRSMSATFSSGESTWMNANVVLTKQ